MVSVVMVTWQVMDFVKECLDSIYFQSYENFELIVVDNGSDDGFSEFIKKNYKEVILIENKKNEGFCKANNQGIIKASGEFIFTLNADVVLEGDFIEKIINDSSAGSDDIGMFCGKMLRSDKRTIDSTGLILSKTRRFYDRGSEEIDEGQYDDDHYNIFGVCAGSAVYRKKMLEDVRFNGQYFDENFFFLGEDFDLSYRGRLKGYKPKYIPDAVCYHKRGSAPHKSKFKQILSFRNRYYIILKYETLKTILPSIHRFLIYDLSRFFYLMFTNKYLFPTIKEMYEKRSDIKRWRKVFC
ncbi:glycosyltransferase family 2 protein [bacterium]|nr:glycosyltransferase family 2 protein [bacterium]